MYTRNFNRKFQTLQSFCLNVVVKKKEFFNEILLISYTRLVITIVSPQTLNAYCLINTFCLISFRF